MLNSLISPLMHLQDCSVNCRIDYKTRITQPGMLTVVYSTEAERSEYLTYLRYLQREGWIASEIVSGDVEPLQGLTGLKFTRVNVLSEA